MGRPSKTSVRVDENITIYPRPMKTGTIWYGRYRINKRELAEGKPFITESLKTSNQDDATYKAKERYLEIHFKERTDQSIRGKYVKDAINDYMSWYKLRLDTRQGLDTRGRFSPGQYRNYRKTLVRYWLEYIGDTELTMVRYETFEEYEIWRRNYYKNKRAEGLPVHHNAKDNPSDRTILMELNAMKVCLRWARNNRYYNGTEISFRFSAKKTRRSAFTLEQYLKLVRYMRTNKFYNKGKHGQDKLIRRSRDQIRAYILFLANVGARPGTEVKTLRWKDIEFDESPDFGKYIRIQIPSTGKTGKRRQSIGRYTARRALERLRENREDNLDPDDYVFCSKEGKPISNFRDIFHAVTEEAGVQFYKDGNTTMKHSPYSLRHSYITFRLRYTKTPDLLAIARNCGTSVAMIEQYYADVIPQHYLERLL